MAEYIKKAELIKACNYIVCYEDDEETFGISEARIDLMPTINIITCKDCKHSNVDKMGWYCNKHYHRYSDPDTHFCSDGEVEY